MLQTASLTQRQKAMREAVSGIKNYLELRDAAKMCRDFPSAAGPYMSLSMDVLFLVA